MLILDNLEEIIGKDPCIDCEFFDKFVSGGCDRREGTCWKKNDYDSKQAVLAHAHEVDWKKLDELLAEFIREHPIIIGAVLAKNPLQDKDRFSQFLQSNLDTQKKTQEKKR